MDLESVLLLAELPKKKKPRPVKMGLTSEELVKALSSIEPSIRAMSFNYLGHGWADDVLQETALRAWRSLQGFKCDSAPETWLYSIARNVCTNFFNERSKEREALSRLKKVAPLHHFPSAEIVVEIKQFISKLTKRERVIMGAAVTASMDEVAERFHRPVGTIKGKIYRIRKKEED